MLFEKALARPVSNWNITKDAFIFQERHDTPTVYLIRLFPSEE